MLAVQYSSKNCGVIYVFHPSVDFYYLREVFLLILGVFDWNLEYNMLFTITHFGRLSTNWTGWWTNLKTKTCYSHKKLNKQY